MLKTKLKAVVATIVCLLLIMGIGIAPATAVGAVDLPQVNAGDNTWVVDQSETISRVNEGRLSKALKEIAKETGKEVRFVVVRRLNFGETIDSFADELFSRWYPTAEDQQNQLLLVLDTLTNNVTIRAGEGVKTNIPDGFIASISEDSIGIPLRQGDKYNQALLDTSDRLAAVIAQQPDPGPPTVEEIQTGGTFTRAEDTDDGIATVWVVVILVVATVIPMVTYFWYVGFPGS